MEKKEVNKGFVYFLVFMFLGFLLLASTGVYNNKVTGAATSTFGDAGNVMRDALILPFESVLKPFFETAFGDQYYLYSIKLLLIIVLSILFNLGTSMIFKENKRSARLVAIIFATLGVVLIPSTALVGLFGQFGGQPGFIGSLIIIFILLAFVLGIFIPLLKWKAQGMGNNVLRGISFFSFIFLISWVQNSFIGSIGLLSKGFFSMVLSILTLVCLIMFIVSLIRAFSGNVAEGATAIARAGGRGLERLAETGGIRAQPGRIGGFLRGIWGRRGDERMMQGEITQIQSHNDEIKMNISEATNNVRSGFDTADVANRLNSLRIILTNENARLNRRTINQIINSFDDRRQIVIRNGLMGLINENNRMIRQINPLINDRGVPTGLIGLKNRSKGNTIVDALSNYFNNRATYIGMLR